MKPRIILFSGKGGVGKTSVAAATGVRAAELGHRTIVLSLDIAHSLSDAFDLPVGLHEKNEGRPVHIADRLDIQEIDVQEELERWWSEVYKYLAAVFSATGMGDLMAEEMAILPGMEEIIGLLYINQYIEERSYDVIILDCAPTGESLRFISLPSALEWFMDKIFHLERTVMRVVRPMAKPFAPIPLPDDSYYAAIERLYRRLKGVDKYLLDPQVTTARLVTNAEKMVVRETQRAFMYLCLYEIAVDAVVVNKLIPPHVMDAHFRSWLTAQMGYVEQIEEYFAPIPILKAPLFESEIVGVERLRQLALELYGSRDPTHVLYAEKPYQYHFADGRYVLQLKLPFASREHIDLYRDADELIIRIGSFKRHVLLPHKLIKSRIRSASYKGDTLVIEFAEASES
mgnify:FL=1|jgi:arsenite-transporting ATPase